MTTATKTKKTATGTCNSTSYFGDPCELDHGHSKRHTWDSNDYRRRKWAAQGKLKLDTPTPVTPKKGSTPTSKSATPKKSPVKECIDVMISFDTTGSMRSCIAEVRKNVAGLVEDLFKDIPDLRIGILAHGDYCDAPTHGYYGRNGYVTKMIDLTRDVNALTNFVKTTGDTGGGDEPECYELALHEMRTLASWEGGRNKVIVLIGDERPHPPEYPDNVKNLDWKVECQKLAEKGVAVYTVQCLRKRHADYFYEGAAKLTNGYRLNLENFSETRDMIRAVCYKQQGDEQLKKFKLAVEHSGRMTGGMSKIFTTLLGRDVSTAAGTGDERFKPVRVGRFKVINVANDTAIKDLVKRHGLTFKTGRGFYQFTKRVEIQKNKEVVMRDDTNGAMFTGSDARELLGLPKHIAGVLSPEDVRKLRGEKVTVFVQSTSNNRVLKGGTQFLYEV